MRVGVLSVLLVFAGVGAAAPPNVVHARYVGTRERTFRPVNPTPNVKPFADRYTGR